MGHLDEGEYQSPKYTQQGDDVKEFMDFMDMSI